MLKKLPVTFIQKEFKTRSMEEPATLKAIENILKSKKKNIISIPKPGTPVILIASGGLDSTLVWAYLLEEYKLQVYPLFLRRGQRRVKLEEKAVDFFSQYFQERYPQLSQPVAKLDTPIPPHKIRFKLTKASEQEFTLPGQKRGIPVYTNLLYSYAVQYGYYLELQGTSVRTVVSGIMPSDGEGIKDETLTSIRAINLTTCVLTGDYAWQLLCLPLEPEIGFYYHKSDFLRWAQKLHIPLEKTRSCIMWSPNHCGRCMSCHSRMKAFKEARMEDKTKYGFSLSYWFVNRMRNR